MTESRGPSDTTEPVWTEADVQTVACVLAGRAPYSRHSQRCPVWTGKPADVDVAAARTPPASELARCGCWIMRWARKDARPVLDLLAAAGRLTPEPAHTHTEWGVWWHSGNPEGICLDAGRLQSAEEAHREGVRRIGEYEIDSYTVVCRQHRIYNHGHGAWSGDWVRHSGPHPGPSEVQPEVGVR